MKYADLHIHTNLSDSTHSPAEVVKLSLKSGLSCISITDHDTVDGIEPALKQASGSSLEIIPGIEMTCELDNLEIHILGYFIDCKNDSFLKVLMELRKIRKERIHKMVKKLNELGLKKIDAREVIKLAGGGAVGRVHLAIIMQKIGYISTIPEAFQRFIGNNGPAYVSKFRFQPKEVIELIQKNEGISTLAHPHILNNEDLIKEFVSYGLRGLEVYYPGYTNSTTEHLKSLAKKYNLLLSGGSDCHGDAKVDTAIGKIKIPYELVEELKKANEIQ